MTTKLDELVGYLAGREGSPRLKEELADPLSEASLFLEATRSRSKALVIEAPSEAVAPLARRQSWIAIMALMASLVVLFGLFILFVESRFRRLEESEARRDGEARTRAAQVEATLGRLAEARPVEVGFDHVRTGFDRIEKRFESLEKAQNPRKVDTVLGEIRESLVALRQEISNFEKGNTRQGEEQRATTLEVSRLLRLLISRTQPPAPEPVPGFPNPRHP